MTEQGCMIKNKGGEIRPCYIITEKSSAILPITEPYHYREYK